MENCQSPPYTKNKEVKFEIKWEQLETEIDKMETINTKLDLKSIAKFENYEMEKEVDENKMLVQTDEIEFNCEETEKGSTQELMKPSHDIVLSLLETPFYRRNEVEKQEILAIRPTPKIKAIFNEKKKGRLSLRTYQYSWYDNYQWLCGSSYKESLYCWPCLLLGKAKHSWCSKDGYKDLKNFSRSSKTHEGSKEHIKNFLALKRLQQNNTNIENALRENVDLTKVLYNENVRKNRLLIGYFVDVIITLAKQELDFRSHESCSKGNFKEILKCFIKRNPELAAHCEKFSNIFTERIEIIQNELVSCIHGYLTDFIKSEVSDKECYFFGVIVDDITDLTDHSQCSITLRFVRNGCLCERFLGLFDVGENRTAAVLCELLVTILEPHHFRKKLVAQCYDGASVIPSELNELHTMVKSAAPLALLAHSCMHLLSFHLQQGANQIDKSRIFFATLSSIPAYFHRSTKRSLVLEKIIGRDIQWSDEPWKIVNLVASEWDNLILVFEAIIKDRTSSSAAVTTAKGYLNNFQDFEFAFLTKIYKEIFGCTNLLFEILETKQMDVNHCSEKFETTSQKILELRNEKKFKNIFNYVKNVTGLPSKRGKSCDDQKVFASYKMLYYEIVDCISLQLHIRFGNLHDLNFLALVDSSKFPEYARKFPEKSFECLLQMYPNVFEVDRLKNELNILYRDHQFLNLGVQKTIGILYEEFKMVFLETYKLFCLVLTIPLTSVLVEKNSSCLKRIRTYLRNNTTQERLNELSVMVIEKELLQDLRADPQFYEDIINRFGNLKQMDLFYKK